MIFEFTTVNNKIITKKECISANIECDIENSVDLLTAIFISNGNGTEYKSVRVYIDEKIIFTGVVDSIITTVNKQGIFEMIKCRNLMAYLLDNHLQPQNIHSLTDGIIFERYLKPYGINIDKILNKPYHGAICVGKAVNIYTVIKEYSKRVFNSIPRINHNGVAILDGTVNDKNIYFTNGVNSLNDNIYCCTDIKVENRRTQVISKVYVHNDNSQSGYPLVINNNQALNREIQCERYLDATLVDSCTYDANKLINKSNAQSKIITVKCNCFVYSPLGANAVVNVCGLEYKNLIVKSVVYTFNENGITSIVTMSEREE